MMSGSAMPTTLHGRSPHLGSLSGGSTARFAAPSLEQVTDLRRGIMLGNCIAGTSTRLSYACPRTRLNRAISTGVHLLDRTAAEP